MLKKKAHVFRPSGDEGQANQITRWHHRHEQPGLPRPYGGGKSIEQAVEAAKRDGKHVLVQSDNFGCPWCLVCEKLLMAHPEIVAKLKRDLVDVVSNQRLSQQKPLHSTRFVSAAIRASFETWLWRRLASARDQSCRAMAQDAVHS